MSFVFIGKEPEPPGFSRRSLVCLRPEQSVPAEALPELGVSSLNRFTNYRR
jgi:hypothetical protein